jgi:hypothetical protein
VLPPVRRPGKPGRVLSNLGMTEYHLHDCRSSAGYYWQAIAAYEETGDHLGTARALASLAAAETELGCTTRQQNTCGWLPCSASAGCSASAAACRGGSPRGRGKET